MIINILWVCIYVCGMRMWLCYFGIIVIHSYTLLFSYSALLRVDLANSTVRYNRESVSRNEPLPGVSIGEPLPGVSRSEPLPGVTRSEPLPGVSRNELEPSQEVSRC